MSTKKIGTSIYPIITTSKLIFITTQRFQQTKMNHVTYTSTSINYIAE